MCMLGFPTARLLVLMIVAAACNAPAHEGFTSVHFEEVTTAATTTGSVEPTTDGAVQTVTGASTDSAGGASEGADSSDSTAAEADSSSSTGEVLPPMILEVDMPAKVSLAGPIAVTVTTLRTTSAQIRLDGALLDTLTDEGDGVFAGVVPVYGAVDQGEHVLEVIAAHGDLTDQREIPFEVSTPVPGGLAWAMNGPLGSRTNRIALSPAGELFEIGTQVFGGVPRPALSVRSALTGEVQSSTLVLDTREGSAEDLALTPDGDLWVAMNVKEPNASWRPRIALFDKFGNDLGVEMIGDAGGTVRAVDSDGLGGFFAVGIAGTGKSDVMDVAFWRMNSDHVPVFSGQTWDYVAADKIEHAFTDFGTDVVVDGDVAWIVGGSYGLHDIKPDMRMRGLIVRLDIDTGVVLAPAIVASWAGVYTQSMFFGAGLAPEGIVVTGHGYNDAGDLQRVETSRYSAAGVRTWHRPDKGAVEARGNAVALNAHGVAVIAATVREGSATRGYLLGRVVGEFTQTFDLGFPVSKEASACGGVAVDPWDQALGGGHVTTGGVMQARALRVHQ